MFVGGSFIPSIPNATPTAVAGSLGYASSLSELASSIGVMFWLTLFCFGEIADVGYTSVERISRLSTFGCSGSYALGTATIGDIYQVEERGTGMGIFLGAMLFGLTVAPPIGGNSSLQLLVLQVVLGVWSVILLVLLAFFFPEMAHTGSCGIDKMQSSNRRPNVMAVTLANTFTNGIGVGLCFSRTSPGFPFTIARTRVYAVHTLCRNYRGRRDQHSRSRLDLGWIFRLHKSAAIHSTVGKYVPTELAEREIGRRRGHRGRGYYSAAEVQDVLMIRVVGLANGPWARSQMAIRAVI
ncbi:hypothetical protein EV363DRAFT_1172578 [Boletus edulis]|nr:hypothetical protein EV363DRAFT_1172578 [Boletus edulis]